MLGLQPSAGPARGKGDRRVMAVIHTASRHAAGLKLCSYFVLKPDASENGKYEVASTSRRAARQGESLSLLFLGNTFWQANPVGIGLGAEP
jgi:hypothetical protein